MHGEECTVTVVAGETLVTCPGGRELSLIRKKNNGREASACFSPVDRKGCLACPLAGRCLSTKRSRRKEFVISETKFQYLDVIHRHQAKMETEDAQRIYSRRWPTIERQYGHVKHNLGFNHFLRRGLGNVRAEWQLLCSAINMRRLFMLGQMAENA